MSALSADEIAAKWTNSIRPARPWSEVVCRYCQYNAVIEARGTCSWCGAPRTPEAASERSTEANIARAVSFMRGMTAFSGGR